MYIRSYIHVREIQSDRKYLNTKTIIFYLRLSVTEFPIVYFSYAMQYLITYLFIENLRRDLWEKVPNFDRYIKMILLFMTQSLEIFPIDLRKDFFS